MRKPRKSIPNGVKMTNRYYKTAGDASPVVTFADEKAHGEPAMG